MPADRKPFRVLFVCMGNICRSPAAEIVFRQQVSEAGLNDSIHIDSAGTIGYHSGKRPDPRMADTLRRRGYPIAGRARQVTARDLADFDLLLAADPENLAVDYCVDKEADHVPDPYYGGQQGFEEVADLVEDACAGLLDEIRRKRA